MTPSQTASTCFGDGIWIRALYDGSALTFLLPVTIRSFYARHSLALLGAVGVRRGIAADFPCDGVGLAFPLQAPNIIVSHPLIHTAYRCLNVCFVSPM